MHGHACKTVCFQRMYLWRNLCTLYLHACHWGESYRTEATRVFAVVVVLTCVTYFCERRLTPLCVEHIFWSCETSTVNAMHFLWKSFYTPVRARKQTKKGLEGFVGISHLYWSFSSNIMAMKRLMNKRDRVRLQRWPSRSAASYWLNWQHSGYSIVKCHW